MIRKFLIWILNHFGFVGLPEEKDYTYEYDPDYDGDD